MKNSLKHILDDIFGDGIQDNDKKSFICFLKGCGAYDEYMNNLEIPILKESNELYENNSYVAFYHIISSSFLWENTKDGFEYWQIISTLHNFIINIKCQYNIPKPNYSLHNYLAHHDYYSLNSMKTINYLLSISKIKDKKLHTFISKFIELCKENNLLYHK